MQVEVSEGRVSPDLQEKCVIELVKRSRIRVSRAIEREKRLIRVQVDSPWSSLYRARRIVHLRSTDSATTANEIRRAENAKFVQFVRPRFRASYTRQSLAQKAEMTHSSDVGAVDERARRVFEQVGENDGAVLSSFGVKSVLHCQSGCIGSASAGNRRFGGRGPKLENIEQGSTATAAHQSRRCPPAPRPIRPVSIRGRTSRSRPRRATCAVCSRMLHRSDCVLTTVRRGWRARGQRRGSRRGRLGTGRGGDGGAARRDSDTCEL